MVGENRDTRSRIHECTISLNSASDLATKLQTLLAETNKSREYQKRRQKMNNGNFQRWLAFALDFTYSKESTFHRSVQNLFAL